MIDITFVKTWSACYPLKYDTDYYDPFIAQGRIGDVISLRKLTEWKNAGPGHRPMNLSGNKEKAFRKFISNLARYLGVDGQQNLRNDFSHNAPVWSIFWHHVLFQTPIFDVYTRMAYLWDTTGKILTKDLATIHSPLHWKIYDQYHDWFDRTLERLRREDETITERLLDRALFCWGEAETKKMKQRTKRRSVRRCRAARER